MRSWRRGGQATLEVSGGDTARLAAWNGLLGRSGPSVVIRAERAGDTADHAETLQVA
jgi:hypothetical protein